MSLKTLLKIIMAKFHGMNGKKGKQMDFPPIRRSEGEKIPFRTNRELAEILEGEQIR